jgi:hypothetical protein
MGANWIIVSVVNDWALTDCFVVQRLVFWDVAPCKPTFHRCVLPPTSSR